MRKLGTVFLAVVAVLFLAGPSFAKKAKLSEDDLDRITAAGQPKIIQLSNVSASGDISLTFDDLESTILTLDPDSQTNLRALTLNNIVGENQIANGLNIFSTRGGGVTQSNTILQSWGSIKVLDVVTASVDSSATSGDNNVSDNRTNNQSNTNTANATASGKCVGFCNPSGSQSGSNTNDQSGDNGGNTTGAAAAVAAVIGVPIFMTADDIIHLQDVTSTSGGVTVEIQQDGLDILDVTGNSQTNLAALVVNNIAGKNQIANAINIANGGVVVLRTGATTNNAEIIIDALSALGTSTQNNNIQQFRGTPSGVTLGPVKACVAAGAAVATAC
jgi:hypothetical protein